LWTSNQRGEDPDEIYAKIFDDEGVEHFFTSREIEFFGDPILGAQWAHVTYTFDVDPQPQFETLVLGAHLLAGEVIVLDQVDVETRCVPEPSTLVLLALGSVGPLLVWRRRRLAAAGQTGSLGPRSAPRTGDAYCHRLLHSPVSGESS